MSNWKVESEFEHDGLKCVVIMTQTGHRCGYLGVPEENKLNGVDYGDIHRECDIDVHGGLTYSDGYPTFPIDSDLWWFGFNCAHFGDGKDLELAKSYGLLDDREYQIYKDAFCHFGNEPVKSKSYCEDQCRNLASQLAKASADV